MFCVQRVEGTIESRCRRRDKTVQHPNPSTQMKILIPLEGIQGVAALDMDDIDILEAPHCGALFSQIAATREEFKHGDDRTENRGSDVSPLPEFNSSGIPSRNTNKDISINERSCSGRHVLPPSASTAEQRFVRQQYLLCPPTYHRKEYQQDYLFPACELCVDRFLLAERQEHGQDHEQHLSGPWELSSAL